MMKLIASNGDDTIELGSGFTFESAYELILKNDSDPDDAPWLPGYDLELIDGDERWAFECDCWVPLFG